jgi:hypothetical protein
MFRRKAQEPTPTPTVKIGLAAPIVVEDGDLDRVRSLMLQFNQGVGTDAGIRSFGIAFNRAGGFLSDMNALDAVRTNPDATKRPWLWVAAVAREALVEGDTMLVARIALMTQFWNAQVAPKLGPADWFDGIVDRISDGARAQIFSVALQALPTLPAEQIVMENQSGVLKAGGVLALSAGEVLAVETLVEAGVADRARQILAG